MNLIVGQQLAVVDNLGRRIGSLVIDEARERLLLGNFVRGPDYSSVEPLFLEFEEIANDQIFSLIDSAQEPIENLGIRLVSNAGTENWPVRDVQIWSDGGMSCRLKEDEPGAVQLDVEANGTAVHLPPLTTIPRAV